MICIPNCDKIVPGMTMAAGQCNIPAIFVSGGPMEAGKTFRWRRSVDSVVATRSPPRAGRMDDADGWRKWNARLSDLRLLLGDVHRQFHELPGRGAGYPAAAATGRCWPPTPTAGELFLQRPADRRVDRAITTGRTPQLLPRGIATFEAFENAMSLDIAMGGSTNTVLHLLAAAHEAGWPSP